MLQNLVYPTISLWLPHVKGRPCVTSCRSGEAGKFCKDKNFHAIYIALILQKPTFHNL